METEYTDAECAQKKVFDGMASASIISNCAGIDTSNTHVITMSTLRKFLETRQMEIKSEDEVRAIIRVGVVGAQVAPNLIKIVCEHKPSAITSKFHLPIFPFASNLNSAMNQIPRSVLRNV